MGRARRRLTESEFAYFDGCCWVTLFSIRTAFRAGHFKSADVVTPDPSSIGKFDFVCITEELGCLDWIVDFMQRRRPYRGTMYRNGLLVSLDSSTWSPELLRHRICALAVQRSFNGEAEESSHKRLTIVHEHGGPSCELVVSPDCVQLKHRPELHIRTRRHPDEARVRIPGSALLAIGKMSVWLVYM